MGSLTVGKNSRVTIDDLPLQVHEDYAGRVHDPAFSADTALVSQNPEVLALTATYLPLWDELFDVRQCNVPWAAFPSPPSSRRQSRPIFTHRVFPDIDLEKLTANTVVSLAVEEQQSALANLQEAVERLNKLLAFIRAKQLQYRQG